jgi:dynein heavy chain
MPECAKTNVDLIRLWMHEAERVYGDKFIDEHDIETFQKLVKNICARSFEVNNIYCYLLNI